VTRSTAEGAAVGASRGGQVGAAIGGATALVRSGLEKGNRSKLFLIVVVGSTLGLAPLVAPLLIAGTAAVAIGGFEADQNTGAYNATSQAMSFPESSIDAEEGASEQTGVPWEVLSAVIFYETGPGVGMGGTPGTCPPPASGQNGGTIPATGAAAPSPQPYCPAVAASDNSNRPTPGEPRSTETGLSTTIDAAPSPPTRFLGPYGIDSNALAGVEKTQASNIGWSSVWVARRIRASLEKQPSWDNQPFDAGEMVTDGERSNYIDLADPNAQTVQAGYLKALADLPVAGNSPALDRNVLGLAQDWYLGLNPTGTANLAGALTCGIPAGTGLRVPSPSGESLTVDAQQLSNAALIVHTGQSLNVPLQGLVVAIMAALTESRIENLPNPTVPGSETDPNVQWGGYSISNPPHDGTSVGFFQQQDNWGPVTLRMNPTGQTKSFFGDPSAGPPGLLQIPNWHTLPLATAAQAVQESAFPTRYAGWQPGAEAIVNDVLNIPCTGSTVTASTPQAHKAIAAAQAELGRPYVWGGGGGPPINGPSGSAAAPANQVGQPGFDCSGLVQFAFSRAGISLPRTTDAQFADVRASGKLVTSIPQLQVGDLVFFGGAGYDGSRTAPGHVGIYIGNSQMVDAPFTGVDVRIDKFSSAGFVGGGPA
jgi:cell wall-associated NlpC family hydrolase